MRFDRTTFALTFGAAAVGIFAQGRNSFEAASPSIRAEPDDPRLARVLIIGDSISVGYTPDVRRRLAGRANVHRIAENGSATTNGVAKLDHWLGTNHWDVIHFNFGLHDMKIVAGGIRMVPIEEYERNLEVIATRLEKTGAKLIWASTTPVPEGKLDPPRQPGEEVRYNVVASRVMGKHSILVNDLHAFALPRVKDWQIPANVHFTPGGYDALAEEIVRVMIPFAAKPSANAQ